jgi:hypothetical protein
MQVFQGPGRKGDNGVGLLETVAANNFRMGGRGDECLGFFIQAV